jgi:hypothetical protein
MLFLTGNPGVSPSRSEPCAGGEVAAGKECSRHPAGRTARPSVSLVLTSPKPLVKMSVLRSCKPWRRECPPARGRLGWCWCPFEKARTSPFTAADRTATHRRFWQWHPPQNKLRLRVSGDLNTNTRSQPNSIPRGQPGLWRSLVTRGGQSSY